MVTVIVSSQKNKTELSEFTLNIESTIGAAYEIVLIENPGKYSLCQAYNMGVEKAKFKYICFVHDDVMFRTNDWGLHLINLMENDKKIGLIGVAGTKFKSSYPSAWGQSPFLYKFRRGRIIHKIGNKQESLLEFDNSSNEPSVLENVICLDGVFLFSKKEVFDLVRFDDVMLTHFHGYDIDISLQMYFKNYSIMVDRNILLEHKSGGNHSKENTIANRKIGQKWKYRLPSATLDTNISKFTLYYLDILNWYYFISKALMRKLNKN